MGIYAPTFNRTCDPRLNEMKGGARLLLCSSSLLLLAPTAATAQEASDPLDRGIAISVATGLTSVYQGGETYLVSAVIPTPGAGPVEVALEYTPTPVVGSAKILWLGLRTSGGTIQDPVYSGWRLGILDGPSVNGGVVDLHFGVQVGWRGLGIFVEPAALAGVDSGLFVGGRVTAGVSWTFR